MRFRTLFKPGLKNSIHLFNRFQSAKKYLHYYVTAFNGRGHGIHSPFVFDFVTNVLNDKTCYPVYDTIEQQRKKLLADKSVIYVEDYGAGSVRIKNEQRKIQDIAATSLKSKKYAQLLYRIVRHYNPGIIVELGTSLGITSGYLALAQTNASVFTLEGAPQVAAIAKNTLHASGAKNIELVEGNFSTTLPQVLSRLHKIGLAFIDGNHRKEPTLNYFEQLLNHTDHSSILIFDDIHWSSGMEQAWEQIRQHPAVTLSIDLYFLGLVFFNTDINHKQHYQIRF
jgi:predicted O-methyltransferase YrrM